MGEKSVNITHDLKSYIFYFFAWFAKDNAYNDTLNKTLTLRYAWRYYILCYGTKLFMFLSFNNNREEKAMAPRSSTLAWKIPWTEEPGGLQSMGSGRVGHDWAPSLSLFTFMHWRRKWQPTPVFLPGESQGWGSLAGCCLWDRTESHTTEAT